MNQLVALKVLVGLAQEVAIISDDDDSQGLVTHSPHLLSVGFTKEAPPGALFCFSGTYFNRKLLIGL